MQTLQDMTTDMIATKIAELDAKMPTPDMLEVIMELIDTLVQDDLNETVEGWVQREVDEGKTVEEAKVTLIQHYYNRTIESEGPLGKFFAKQCFEAIMSSLGDIDDLGVK
jgi:hypothetical protein